MSKANELRRFFVGIHVDTRNHVRGNMRYTYEDDDRGEFVDAENAIDAVKLVEKERDAALDEASKWKTMSSNYDKRVTHLQSGIEKVVDLLHGETVDRQSIAAALHNLVHGSQG